MKRLIQIAKEQNIGVNTLIDYCKTLGHSKVTQHSKIDSKLESQIITLHKGKNKVSQELILNDLPNDFSLENPFESEQIEIVAEGDQFSKRQKRILTIEEFKVETVFSDFEAHSICLGLDNGHARHLARKYFKTKFPLK